MNVYSVFVFAVLAISSASGIINLGGGKKCGGNGGYGSGYGSGVIIGAPKPGGNFPFHLKPKGSNPKAMEAKTVPTTKSESKDNVVDNQRDSEVSNGATNKKEQNLEDSGCQSCSAMPRSLAQKFFKNKFSSLSQSAVNSMPTSPYLNQSDALNFDDRLRKAVPGRRKSSGLRCIFTKVPVSNKDIIMEIFGDVNLNNGTTENQEPGKKRKVLMYPPENHKHCVEKEVVRIEIQHDGRFLRRSCYPNSTLVHFKDSDGDTRFFVIAMESIAAKKEVTIGFDKDFRFSKVPLKCAYHRGKMDKCKLEQHRRVVVEEIDD